MNIELEKESKKADELDLEITMNQLLELREIHKNSKDKYLLNWIEDYIDELRQKFMEEKNEKNTR